MDALKPFFKRIDHLGIAVPSLDEAMPVYETLMGRPVGHIEEVPDQKVRTAFFQVGESHFELWKVQIPMGQSGDTCQSGAEGIHHVCVEVTDINAVLSHYKDAGIRLIDEEPRRGAHNMWVAFVHPAATGGVLLELSQPMDER